MLPNTMGAKRAILVLSLRHKLRDAAVHELTNTIFQHINTGNANEIMCPDGPPLQYYQHLNLVVHWGEALCFSY